MVVAVVVVAIGRTAILWIIDPATATESSSSTPSSVPFKKKGCEYLLP
ncbi:hypothetical protein CY0110_30835 [Crocosphaera chwakensis CCY0110]|uniref:Uncharacterized protein n=1 Tax=Crocosphaera chwakensis CCY0110 TaxID=391612 RepID=A3IVY0_9CHRO|nr:hypothetical protein CY0110_30835 [Crocosphaera chwakensis CCY0110]